ncbi:NAD-dependent epimerase/dehydratase family protein [Pelagibacterales bacterium SAG-MED39]|nr:NAD-dependent epimerase/dehydratase family protein [Pelagibacterales bacterium SAG-MED39]
MKNILIIGHKSFIAKNFINDFGYKFNLFYLKKYFKRKDKNFPKVLKLFIKKNSINVILNFAANNDNSYKNENFEKILESNFYLPITLINISNFFKIPLFIFLSKDMYKENKIKNFYSLSKGMLKTFINNSKFSCKLRLLNIDSLYGPYDLKKNRIFPSIFHNLYNKNKIKINLNQIKNFTYVKDLNKILFNLIFKKKQFIYKEIKSEKINITSVYRLFKKNKFYNLSKKNSKYHALFLTREWYKKYYGKK